MHNQHRSPDPTKIERATATSTVALFFDSFIFSPSFKELGLDSQRVKKLASKLHVHSVSFAANLVHTRRALSNAVINSHQEPVSGQACNPLDPHWFPFLFALEELYGTRYQSGSFSLINVGSGNHCLRSFSFLFFPIFLILKWGLPVVEVFVAHCWSAVLWHSFMRLP